MWLLAKILLGSFCGFAIDFLWDLEEVLPLVFFSPYLKAMLELYAEALWVFPE